MKDLRSPSLWQAITIMSSSPSPSTTSPRLKSCSVQDRIHHVSRNHDDGRIEPNSKSPVYADSDSDDASQLGDLPPVVNHMSCYAKRASSRFRPYQPGKRVPTALEHRFIAKSLLKQHEADLSLEDVQQVF